MTSYFAMLVYTIVYMVQTVGAIIAANRDGFYNASKKILAIWLPFCSNGRGSDDDHSFWTIPDTIGDCNRATRGCRNFQNHRVS